MERLGWLLAVALAVGVGAQAWALVHEAPSHRTLPIFVPVSLEHERAMRAERGQPAGRGGEEAVDLARALDGAGLDAATAAAVAPRLAAMKELRARLLAARDRRHQLNVAMMEVGARLGAELLPAQWDVIQSRRDALRAPVDAALFDRVAAQLGTPP